MSKKVSGDTNDGIRNIKRPYRKKAFQNKYSQKADAVDPTPLPYSSYSTETSVATTPVRAGIDAATYKRPVRPSPNALTLHSQGIDKAAYPWQLVPKQDSSNVIQRQVVNLSSLGGGNLDAGEYIDLLVLNNNETGTIGTQTWSGTPLIPTESTLDIDTPPTFPETSSTTVGSSTFTSTSTGVFTGGDSVGGLFTGTTSTPSGSGNTLAESGRKNELYLIQSFGHTEPTTAGSAGVRYQIWVDGILLYEWDDFQWSVVVPMKDQWQFMVPLVIEKQMVFRIINTGTVAGVDVLTGNVQACFVGWSEQFNGYTDVGRQALESGV